MADQNFNPPPEIIPGYASGQEIADALDRSANAVPDAPLGGPFLRVRGEWIDSEEALADKVGPEGPRGPRGPIGPAGPDGPPGLSYSEMVVLHYRVPALGLDTINTKDSSDLRGNTYEMVSGRDDESSFLVLYNGQPLVPVDDWTLDVLNSRIVFVDTLVGEGNEVVIATISGKDPLGEGTPPPVEGGLNWVAFPANPLSPGNSGDISYSSGYLAMYNDLINRWIYLAASEVSPI